MNRGHGVRSTFMSSQRKIEETIRSMCDEEGVKVTEVKGGSRRRLICMIRKRIAQELIERYGIPIAIVAAETGVTTIAISTLMTQC